MSMRVIAGTYRHRNLDYPINNINIRPTKDRIREAFFSSLGDITNKVFLDLCAGCGAMGIEAISRGANKSFFIDNNNISISYIKKNINLLNILNYEIIKMDALESLSMFKNSNQQFDIIYFDPPYASDMYESVISYIYNNEILKDNGIFAFEADKNINLENAWKGKIKEYHYGDIKVVVLKK